MTITLSISLFLLLVTSVLAKTCARDAQCGSMPYAVCSGGQEDCLYTLDGLAVSGDGKVYYGEFCRAPDNEYTIKGVKVNTTLKSVDISTGKIEQIFTEQLSRSGNIGGVFGINAKNLFVNRYNRYTGLNKFNIVTKNEENVILRFYNAIAFTTDTYTCAFSAYSSPDDYREYYTINKYTGIIASSKATPKVLYTVLAGGCGAIFVSGNNIYFAVTSYVADNIESSTVYRGDVNCKNCTVPAPLFTVNGTLSGFTQNPADTSKFFFGTEFGLFSFNTAKNQIATITTDANKGVMAFYQGSIIYNNGKLIRSINPTTKKTKDINTKKVGTCVCAYGFSGSDCTTCTNGSVVWDSYNNPSCVASSSS
eukprot:TRINITY_DN1539_c0_g1_i1.p1 TRINITY_DN1539_c0_g1~~TRINITY_DN1539_c0_g1_i1.p1  ORF type:complete len:365 (+),score=111.36 TRINITY_DN1539_c0_g1_i1:151-1245(+)